MSDPVLVSAIRAMANERRLWILEWLKDPRAHFPPQVDGDLVADGVCGILIADKLGISQPTVSEHLKVLSQAADIVEPLPSAFPTPMRAPASACPSHVADDRQQTSHLPQQNYCLYQINQIILSRYSKKHAIYTKS